MSKKVQQLYFNLIKQIADSGKEPMCADEEYIDLFYPEARVGRSRALDYTVKMKESEAKIICNLCPFKQACAEYAITSKEEFGVWGSTTPSERTSLYRGRSTMPEVTITPLLDE